MSALSKITFPIVLVVFLISSCGEIGAAVSLASVGPSKVVMPTAHQDLFSDPLSEGLSERETNASQVVAEEFSKQISSVEWLAPLAPVALSPFFGITLLSGLACFGPDWLPENALLSEGSPLANPNLFWIFLVLTALTSAPRFSKVSKPIMQVADFLETYSAIVILIVLKVMSMDAFQSVSEPTEVSMTQAGFLSASWEGLLMIAMVINIIVVNSVKFFFEILVWITPVPFLDACFEALNKSLCAGLMAIYAFSPLVALAINGLLFFCCALVFVWIRRREIFFRTMLVDWMVRQFRKNKISVPDKLVVFPKTAVGSIPARSRCLLSKTDDGWELLNQRMLFPHRRELVSGSAELEKGWWSNSILFESGERLTFSSKFSDQSELLAQQFKIEMAAESESIDIDAGRQLEFA